MAGSAVHDNELRIVVTQRSSTIATVISFAEILKNNELAVERRIMTSTVEIKDDSRGRPVQKAKIEIVLGKSAKFDVLMAASQEEKDTEGRLSQSGNLQEQI